MRLRNYTFPYISLLDTATMCAWPPCPKFLLMGKLSVTCMMYQSAFDFKKNWGAPYRHWAFAH